MKRILAFVLTAAMLLALVGCGSSGTDTAKLDDILSKLMSIQSTLDSMEAALAEEEPAEEAPAEEVPAEEAPAEEAPEPAGDDLSEIPAGNETLKIGLMVHQTGWFAGVDTPNFYEFNAMIDYVNEDLGGWTVGDTTYTLESVCVDGQSDYPALRTAAMSLVDAGVDFVVETNDFWVNSCADVFEDEGIMHVSAYCVLAPDYMIPEHPMAFTGSNGAAGDYRTACAALAEFFPDVKTIVMCENDNGNIDLTYPLIQEYASEYGLEVIDKVIFPGDTTDYSSVAQQLVDSGADAFYGSGAPDAYGAILKAVRALGSDMVCACVQGKPATALIEYAGIEFADRAFTLGGSVRPEDADKNTDIMNALIAKVAEKYGDENAAMFDGAAANSLYIMLQLMQKAGSVDPAVVAAEWEKGGEIETIYGLGSIGGEETYGVANHAVGSPRAVSIVDKEAEDNWYFAGWVETDIP